MVTETPEIYAKYILPKIIQRDRSSGRLDWIFNIIEGRTEQEDIILRSHSTATGSLKEIDQEGFLLLPDLNWDRKTMSGLHLLALVERRDIWSLRDLRKKHVNWLRRMREKVLDATVEVYGKQGVERDMLKLYVHCKFAYVLHSWTRDVLRYSPLVLLTLALSCTDISFPDHPTYYHFHIHVVNVMLEASGNTQSVGKAFGLENLISQIENMESRLDRGAQEESGMQNVELTYFVGEEGELWKEVFGKLKRGEEITM